MLCHGTAIFPLANASARLIFMNWTRGLGRFALVGLVGTAAHFLILHISVTEAGLSPVVASSIGALAGALLNYLLNRRFTFKSAQTHFVALPKFALVAALGLIINALLIHALSFFDLHYFAAQAFASLVVLLIGFSINRFWTFKF